MIPRLRKPCDLLLIVPPFSQVEIQSLAAHVLQAHARQAGYRVNIFYANMHLASRLGPEYAAVCQMNYFLIGERLFARAAWGDRVPPFRTGDIYDYESLYGRQVDPLCFFPPADRLSPETLVKLEQAACDWAESLEEDLEDLPCRAAAVTSSFEQNNAAMALLRRIKERNPGIITQIGGFNCEGECAEGIASLDPEARFLDYIFSGEGDRTFPEFLRRLDRGELPEERIVTGSPLTDMDSVPDLDYTDYFEQLEEYLPRLAARKEDLNIALETSRGCWWGEKSQCRFCGYEDRIRFREKSAGRILEELEGMKKWGIRQAHMADLIMPYRYFDDLLPALAESEGYWSFYYEQKVSLDRREIGMLKEARVLDIQPGLETLSGSLLRQMGKGTTLKRNIRFLRDAAEAELKLYWNIVWGLPGEETAEYGKMNALIPLIRHLHPPIGIFYLSLVKFSPFFREPEKYGITGIRPNPSYSLVYPEGTLTDRIALVYTCRYDAETSTDSAEVDRLVRLIGEWNDSWNSLLYRPRLMISRQGDGTPVLLDTRGLEGTEVKTPLTPRQIRVLLDCEAYTGCPEQEWALERKAALLERGEVISLATMDPELRDELERSAQ